MTNEYYSKWWIATKKELEDLRARDAVLETTTKPMKNRQTAHYFVGDLYTKYCMVLQNVAKCLDQSHMIQKNFTIKKLMDAGVIRLNELKEMFVTQLNFSEFYYLDNNLIQQRLIPQRIQIVDPDFVFERPVEVEEMWTAIKNGETIYEPPPPTPRESLEATEETEVEEVIEKPKSVRRFQKVVPVVVLTPEEIAELEHKAKITEAVLLIQSHERGRQSRLYYYDLDMIRQIRTQAVEIQPTPDAPIEVRTEAAITLQKYWRGRWDRRSYKIREVERRILIGMEDPSWKSTKIFEDYDRGLEQRRQGRFQQLKEYFQTDIDEKARLLRVVGPRLFEDITDEIRNWFRVWYNEAKTFDTYPEEIDGGSILIVRGETSSPGQWKADQAKLKREKAKGGDPAKAAKKQKEAEKKKLKQIQDKQKALLKKERQQAKQREEAGKILLKFQKSIAAELFEEGFEEYKTVWDPRPDYLNPLCKPYMDMITEQRCYEVQLEIRKEVDELMRLELGYLNAALAKDKKKKSKPPKKKKKGKKKKEKKELTSGRTIEDLFQELVDNGVIHTYPKVRLADFKGDISYNNFEKRQKNLNPLPCLGDIRGAVMINCILPLGVDSMVKPKAVLIAGPPRSGKRVLANAIFNETRCVLFDISPAVLAGKYSGRKKTKLLVHLINKMSRILQPSIIFIDGAEKPFYKKIPQEEKVNEPRKMAGALYKKIVRPIKPEDKVLVLGISSEPIKAKGKLKRTFDRIIFLPRPDYGSTYLYLRELLMSYRGIDRNFNVSELATMMQNNSFAHLKETLERVLTPSRISELSHKPFDSHEFLQALFEGPEPLTEKIWAKYEKWFNSTALARRRNKLMAIEAEKAEKADKKKKK